MPTSLHPTSPIAKRTIRSFLAALALMLLLAACGGSSAKPVGPFAIGREVYGNICSVCHGSAGQGGTGPSLETVAETWPTCEQQQEWITLGSTGWQESYGDEYGATNKPIKGGMLSMTDQLTPNEIASVAAYERVEYGGLDRDETIRDCGFDIAPAPEG